MNISELISELHNLIESNMDVLLDTEVEVISLWGTLGKIDEVNVTNGRIFLCYVEPE